MSKVRGFHHAMFIFLASVFSPLMFSIKTQSVPRQPRWQPEVVCGGARCCSVCCCRPRGRLREGKEASGAAAAVLLSWPRSAGGQECRGQQPAGEKGASSRNGRRSRPGPAKAAVQCSGPRPDTGAVQGPHSRPGLGRTESDSGQTQHDSIGQGTERRLRASWRG